MRLVFAGMAAAIALLAADIQPVSAQPGGSRNPYCLRDGAMGRGNWDCSYHTMQQCLASASGAGGSCTANPWYRGGKKRGPRRGQQEQPWGW
jgi:hypothetical protein